MAGKSIGLLVEFLGDSSKFKEAVDDVQGRASDFGKRISAGAQALGASLALDKLVDFSKGAISAASDLNEVVSKSQVIFKGSSAEVEKFATSAEKIGLSKRAALDAATGFGNLFNAIGLTGKQTTDYSLKLTGLASDLASFNNTSTDEAITALGAALRGEAEPIRRFGVMLDDATLKQKALDMGLTETTQGTLPPAIRAQAAYALILDQTKTAQGDFARTSDGLANQQRMLSAEFENVKATVGQALLPVMQQIVSVVSDAAGMFSKLSPEVQAAVSQLALFGGGALLAVKAISSTAEALGGLKASFGLTAGAATAAGAVLVAAAGAYVLLANDKAKARQRTDEFVAAMQAETQGTKDSVKALIAKKLVDSDIADQAKKVGLSLEDVAKVIRGESVPAWDDLIKKSQLNNVAQGETIDKHIQFINSTAKLRTAVNDLSTAYSGAVDKTSALESANKALGVQTASASTANTEHAQSIEEINKQLKAEEKASKDVEDALRSQLDATLSLFDSQFALQDAYKDTIEKFDAYGKSLKDKKMKVEEKAAAERDAAKAALALAAATARQAQDQAEMNGQTLTATQTAQLQIDKLSELANTLSPDSSLRQQLKGYVDQLKGVPGTIDTKLNLTLGELVQQGQNALKDKQQLAADGITINLTNKIQVGDKTVDAISQQIRLKDRQLQ